jgi:nitronate monooxygenase
MLKTRITELLGIDYPVMSAPMAMHSGGHLAAAVSKAGGLGSFGGIHPVKGADWLTGEVDYIRSQTDRPFAVGFITNFIPMFEPLFDATLEARPPVVALSFGDPAPYIERAKAAGARVMCQVQAMESAEQAVAAGADVLVLQGNEAGGHTGEARLLPLLAWAAERFPDIPLMAAGGIADGRSLAAALAAGADGAWVGTAFLATPECIEIPERYKQLIVESSGEDTVFTRIFDILSGLPWPERIGARVLRNRFVDDWTGREDELPDSRAELGAAYNAARETFDHELMDIYMGEGVGAITQVRPAADVLHDICDEAERILRERASGMLAG